MAYEVNARIFFDKDHKLDLSSTPEQVINALDGCTTSHIPLIEVTGARGEPLKVNANLIRVVEDVAATPAGEARAVSIG
jgi:hypothetical protein